MNRFTQSYIYVDYNLSKEDLMEEYFRIGFNGYRLLGIREVAWEELVPSDYTPDFKITEWDGDPRKYYKLGMIDTEYYAIWTVWERKSNYMDSHGPQRFSMLAICREAVSTYHALYYTHRTAPLIFAIIVPGHAFGLNWTNFCDPSLIMHRLVERNPYGNPGYLLQEDGLCGPIPHWQEYSQRVFQKSVFKLESGAKYNTNLQHYKCYCFGNTSKSKWHIPENYKPESLPQGGF